MRGREPWLKPRDRAASAAAALAGSKVLLETVAPPAPVGKGLASKELIERMVSAGQILQEAGAGCIVQVGIGPTDNAVDQAGDRRPDSRCCASVADEVATRCEQAMDRGPIEEVAVGICVAAETRCGSIEQRKQ